MSRHAVIRWGGVLALAAGASWVLKSTAILLTGDQPPFVFEMALGLFPLALIGLYATCPRSRLATSGLVLAVVAGVSAVIVGLGVLWGPEDLLAEDEVSLLTPFIVAAGLGSILALLLLGLAVRRTEALPAPWRSLPLTIAVSVFPLMILGGVLEAINERLLEIPLLLLGLGWMALGAVMARSYFPAR